MQEGRNDKDREPRNDSTPGRVWAVAAAAICLVAALLIDGFTDAHGHFIWEEMPGFYAAFGFFACIVLTPIVRVLGRLVRRKEDYYD